MAAPPAAARAPVVREPRIFVADLPAEHLGELAFLLEARPGRVRSPQETAPDLAAADGRLGAHLHGLRIAGRRVAPLFEEALAGDDDALAAAAAWAWLQLDPAAARIPVATAFGAAAEECLAALGEALCHGPLGALAEDLHALAGGANDAVACAAAEALAANGAAPQPPPIARWLAAEDAAVRRSAVRLAARLGRGPLEALARHDGDPAVRSESLRAAAWIGEPWLIAAWKERSFQPAAADAEWAAWFAALAGPDDREAVLALRDAVSLGPARWRALAASGDPGAIAAVLGAMESPDKAEAALALVAFAKLTGVEAVLPRPPLDPEADPDADEPPAIPDVEKARAHWDSNRERYEAGTRWCRGFDLARAESAAAFGELDMESRWEACVRGHRRGSWSGDLSQLECRLGRPASPHPGPEPPREAAPARPRARR